MGRGIAISALRRAAAGSARGRSHRIMLTREYCDDSELSRNSLVHEEGNRDNGSNISGNCIQSKSYFSRCSYSPKSFIWSRNLSSHVRARLGQKDDDLENGFSDLDVLSEADSIVEPQEEVDDDKSISEIEGEMSEEDPNGGTNDLLSDNESDSSFQKITKQKSILSPLAKIVMETPQNSLNSALDKWVEEGNPLGRGEIFLIILNLRRRRLYWKALQFLEWVEANKRIELVERDYASRLDLVAKGHGLEKAERYLEKIPENLRGEIVYRTLLANYVTANNVKKAEDVFKRMKELGLPVTTFSCNQLLLLYKRLDRKKIAEVLLMMEKENVKQSSFTYRILIAAKGSLNDISGMEKILETMKDEGIEPDLMIRTTVAKYYIFAGLNEKAEATLREMEGDDTIENSNARKFLLGLYASLGKEDDVRRIWETCNSNPRMDECLAAIEAWGKLGKVENAEEVFENMLKKWTKLGPKYYIGLLKVYADNKLLAKGKKLAQRMSKDGCFIGPQTWDVLVKLYMGAGELEKADAILHKASQQNKNNKPLYTSYIALLEQYSKKGDIHNAEKIFLRMRQIGYFGRVKPYQALLQTYVNAKTPPYGFRERLKADNIIPNKAMAAQIAATDAFRKTQISDLLD
ncbi:pentatricopeptide repeat-containing protein [Canna indica]|uniref:Pentatricopeptide repeat-containing protein n=1 Tax=Canna indica TaxID=4628 RepID=A0AAQ3QP73_9LILI|nr:pentatricopeptide repeat-containing protein [Canna indica]